MMISLKACELRQTPQDTQDGQTRSPSHRRWDQEAFRAIYAKGDEELSQIIIIVLVILIIH